MVVWLVIAIFTIYQVYSLVMYTLGKKIKKKCGYTIQLTVL